MFLFLDTTEVEGEGDFFLKFLSRERLRPDLNQVIVAFGHPDPRGLGLISRYVEIIKLTSKFLFRTEYTPGRPVMFVFRRGF